MFLYWSLLIKARYKYSRVVYPWKNVCERPCQHTSRYGFFAAKMRKFGLFRSCFCLFWVFLQIWANFGLICMWHHISEFKCSNSLHVRSHKHTPFPTVEITQFKIPNPANRYNHAWRSLLTTHDDLCYVLRRSNF